MDLTMNMESETEAIDHIRFQLDLLKLTSMPVELTGPSVMREQEPKPEAVRVIEELQTAAARIQHS